MMPRLMTGMHFNRPTDSGKLIFSRIRYNKKEIYYISPSLLLIQGGMPHTAEQLYGAHLVKDN